MFAWGTFVGSLLSVIFGRPLSYWFWRGVLEFSTWVVR